mgnify:CR=1 FL=1
MFDHGILERHSLLLVVGILIVVAIGGIVEIAPLFYLESTIEKVQGMRPYTPLELAGRGIYIREGCYVCHSQMIRPLRDEVERYGPYSLAAESMYDHPFQWGSKRTGPDLARVGGKYSDEWHRAHLVDPRSVVPESVMPPYVVLERTELRTEDIADALKAIGITDPKESKDIAFKAPDIAENGAVVPVVDRDLVAGGAELVGGGEAGGACPHDHDIIFHSFTRRGVAHLVDCFPAAERLRRAIVSRRDVVLRAN